MCEKCLLILILSTNIILTSTASPTEVSSNGTNNNTNTSARPSIPSTLATNIVSNKTVSQAVTVKSKHSNETANKHSLHPPVKPFEGSHTFLFVSIFSLGLIGVIVFYVYKKSSGSLSFRDGRYQYSVLNSNNLMDPDDDSNDPLINDFVRNDEDDNFLDISRYRYSDEDDVELLGAGPGEFLCDLSSNSLTVASHTQLAGQQGEQGGACRNNRISSALLNDSDEELLQ